MKKYLTQSQKGFVILFAILIAVIILMMGLGIFSVAIRETVLSSTAREAQYAFYAADAGVECALLEQSKQNAGALNSQAPGGTLECGDFSPVSVSGNGTLISPFVFSILISNDADKRSCAKVSVFDNGQTRRVFSQGYNTCSTQAVPLNSSLLVERDLDVIFGLGGDSSDSIDITGTPGALDDIINEVPIEEASSLNLDAGILKTSTPTGLNQ